MFKVGITLSDNFRQNGIGNSVALRNGIKSDYHNALRNYHSGSSSPLLFISRRPDIPDDGYSEVLQSYMYVSFSIIHIL